MIKQRNIGICILLSIVTCGIYGLYWFVVLTDDINQESGETDATSGGMSLLLTIVTCNIYGWFWAYKMGEKVDIIKNKNGVPSSNSGILSGIWTWNYCICAYAGHCKQICRGYTSDEYRIWSAGL